jgi:FixJ family two-component response regulator
MRAIIMSDEKVYQQQLNILTYVLEDDEDIIYLLDHLFKLNGFVDYKFFKESAEFVKCLNERVHICVIDYYLPGPLNGIDVMKVVLQQNPWCKIIMISGQDDPKVI